MGKAVGNIVYKCVHEALDLDWCDCTDEVRAEYNVTLPKPEDLPPCNHVWANEMNPFINTVQIRCIMCGEIDL